MSEKAVETSNNSKIELNNGLKLIPSDLEKVIAVIAELKEKERLECNWYRSVLELTSEESEGAKAIIHKVV